MMTKVPKYLKSSKKAIKKEKNSNIVYITFLDFVILYFCYCIFVVILDYLCVSAGIASCGCRSVRT